jgi:pantoate--beta-alanine ligase
MTRADASGIDIIPGPTVRDPDGLAMSSRNRFLSAADRARALAIPRALAAAGAEPDWQRAQSVLRSTLHAAGIQPDYAVVREARSLVGPPGVPCAPGAGRMVVAAPVGPVRLLDNAPWPPIEP